MSGSADQEHYLISKKENEHEKAFSRTPKIFSKKVAYFKRGST